MYTDLTDEQIIERRNGGDESGRDYLIAKYKNFVKIITRRYFLVGADRDDIIQEGMIGIFKAIRDYNRAKQTSFYSFAQICVKRQLDTAIKAATRKKHIPLNTYEPIIEHEAAISYGNSPEEQYLNRENLLQTERAMQKILSPYEKKVLEQYLSGKTYAEIATDINKDEKSVDNAVQRIKNKLKGVRENI